MQKETPDELLEITVTMKMRRGYEVKLVGRVNSETRGFPVTIDRPQLMPPQDAVEALAGLIGVTEMLRASLTGDSALPFNRGTTTPPPYRPRR